MRFLKLIVMFLCTYFSFCMQATAMSIYAPPAQISCRTVGVDSENCDGFDTTYLKLANGDSRIPRTPIILNFVDAIADSGGYPQFYYNGANFQYVAILGPANGSIRAKIDDPAWVKKSSGSYYCSNPSGQCPIYSN